jgi:uncharacterized damage-inducible protein DinB
MVISGFIRNKIATSCEPAPEVTMMTDPRLAEVLHLLDPPSGTRLWYGGATAIGSLRGVGHAQAAWKPADDRHSIWELALHIAYWKYAVRRRLDSSVPRGAFPRSPANWPRIPDHADERAWKEDRALLRREHEALVAIARTLGPDELDRRDAKGDYRALDLLFGVASHDVYHTGQIQLMKRLYAKPRGGVTA